MEKLLIILILFIFSICNLHSRNINIRGRVIFEEFEPMPLVLIAINDTIKVGETDFNGFFQINIPAHVKEISFSSIGFEEAVIEISDNCNEVDVILIRSFTYDFATLKKADRLRRKRHDKLPVLHKKAFANGILRTDTPCYTQDFIHYYKKHNKAK